MSSIITIIFSKDPVVLYIFSTLCAVSFPLTFVPMFGLYCNYLKKKNDVFNGMTDRDFEIFSFRSPMYALAYGGLGLLPCLVLGVAVIPIMFISEIMLIKRNQNE